MAGVSKDGYGGGFLGVFFYNSSASTRLGAPLCTILQFFSLCEADYAFVHYTTVLESPGYNCLQSLMKNISYFVLHLPDNTNTGSHGRKDKIFG